MIEYLYVAIVLFIIATLSVSAFIAAIILKIQNNKKPNKSRKMAVGTTIVIVITAIPTLLTLIFVFMITVGLYNKSKLG